MKDSIFRIIDPSPSDFCQSTAMLEIDDPLLYFDKDRPILYGTLLQHEAARASYGSDVGFFCYVGTPDGSRWAGPYLLCDNPIHADELFAPKLISSGDRYYLMGKSNCDGEYGIIVYSAESPLGKFDFVASFRIDADFAPFYSDQGRLSLCLLEGKNLTVREFSDDCLHLSAPKVIQKKSAASSAPCPIEIDGAIHFIQPTKKGLEFLQRSDNPKKPGYKKPTKLKSKLPSASVSEYVDGNGEHYLTVGFCHSFALLPYHNKKGRPALEKAVLLCDREELTAILNQIQEEKNAIKAKADDAKAPKKKINLSIRFSALAAITIALLSAGIGILMGISASGEPKPKK